MNRFDRLSALMTRFSVRVEPKEPIGANLLALECQDKRQPSRVLFSPAGEPLLSHVRNESVVFSAQATLGGDANPLLTALPGLVELNVTDDAETTNLVRLLKDEAEAARCGSGIVLDRLGEVLLVRLLRGQIEQGETATGLIGGLSHPRLSRAIVAIHEQPGRLWKIEDLAVMAGLSVSRFAELFSAIVGQAPMAYLRGWRMLLARQDIERGERIQNVARKYGYGSSEALSRSFRRRYGANPIQFRKAVG